MPDYASLQTLRLLITLNTEELKSCRHLFRTERVQAGPVEVGASHVGLGDFLLSAVPGGSHHLANGQIGAHVYSDEDGEKRLAWRASSASRRSACALSSGRKVNSRSTRG